MPNRPTPPAKCEYFPVCNACQLWDVSYSDQKELKIQGLKALLEVYGVAFSEPISFVSCGESGLRNRVDFTFLYNQVADSFDYGFYDKDKRLISIKKCLQMSPELQEIFNIFIGIKLKFGNSFISKGSVRLRSGLNGLKGCWLDLSNLDIKNLLDDQLYLRKLLAMGFKIEMGQKGKAVVERNGSLKLGDPQPAAWFKTFGVDSQEFPLNCLISDFTQPSWISAKELTAIVLDWVSKTKPQSVIEFGPGIGQFTLPLLAAGIPVAALEVDAEACENLRMNAAELGEASLKIVHDDFQRRQFENNSNLILVNPARSGLKKFTESILNSKAEFVIYISCFPESMCEDLTKIQNEFAVREIKIVDQFPQTNHYESCVLLKRVK